ncbi:MAG TPA: caspase family protein [Polyangium sp.]|nr:caspase family protein [Polyangium sp.]
MIRPAKRFCFQALLALLVGSGCTVTVQSIRTPAPHGEASVSVPNDKPVVNIEAPMADLSAGSCPDEAPPAVPDPTARFVLQNGHPRGIMRIITSADGRTLASSGFDGTVRVWDLRAGILLHRFGTAGVFVSGLSLSADGKRLAYYAPDGTPEGLAIRIVDLDKPNSVRTITPQYGSFQLSSDGKKLAIAVDKLMVFDIDTKTQLLDVPLGMKSPMALDVRFDADNKRVAVASPGEVVIVDALKGNVLHRLTTNYSTLGDVPASLLFTHDRVLVRSSVGVITQHAIQGGAPPVTLPGKYKDMAAAGSRLWVTDIVSAKVSAFSLPNLTPIALPAVNPPLADLIAASVDESTVAFAYSGHRNHTATLIDARDAETMRPLRTIEGYVTGIDAIALNPAADQLVTGSAIGELGRWDLRDGSRAVPLPDEERDYGRMVSMDYAPNGKLFVSTNGSHVARARDATTGRTRRLWIPKSGYDVRFTQFLPKTSDVITVARRIERKVSPTKKLANGMPVIDETYDVFIDKWDLSGPTPEHGLRQNGQIFPPKGTAIGHFKHEATQVAMSPQGDLLALEGTSELVLVRLGTGAVAWVTPLQSLVLGSTKQPDGALDHNSRWVTFSPDGKTLVMSTRRLETNKQGVQVYASKLLVFDVANGKLKGTFPLDTYGPVAWRNNTLVVGGAKPVVLDAPKMTVRARIAALDNTITAVALHPTRDLFVIGGDGGATSFVDDRGGITATVVSTPNGEWLAAAPDGAYRSSIDGARAMAWSFASPLEGFSFERFAARFDKPDVVARRLMGEASPPNVSMSRPPRLALTNTQENVVRTLDRSFTVSAAATSASRVDRVRAFVDGRPVAEKLVCAKEGTATMTIPLHAGQNRVGLVAYDAAGQASNTQNLDVISTSPLAEKPNLYLVAIGVSRYPNMTPDQQLEFADDDARSVVEAFQQQIGLKKPFAKVFTTTLIDEKVTVKSVEEAIASLRAMRPDDLGVVFFAGHGAKLAEGRMVFMTNQASFTRASAEANGIGWDRIHNELSAVRGRVLMMLDACHSGYLTTEIVAPNEELARQLTASNRAGVFVFSAARGSQFSYEVPPAGSGSASRGLELAWTDGQKPPPMSRELPGGHGLFTSALLEALTGDAPDQDRSGATEVGELVDYVTERVRAASNGKQTPWVARREMFGEFFVVPAKK